MGKKGSGGGGGGGVAYDAPPSLCAVVIADPLGRHFYPLTLECPLSLFPLAGVPLIDYTLEFLSRSGVEKVLVYSSRGAAEVERHIRAFGARGEANASFLPGPGAPPPSAAGKRGGGARSGRAISLPGATSVAGAYPSVYASGPASFGPGSAMGDSSAGMASSLPGSSSSSAGSSSSSSSSSSAAAAAAGSSAAAFSSSSSSASGSAVGGSPSTPTGTSSSSSSSSSSHGAPMEVIVRAFPETAQSDVDVLRDVLARGDIEGDFVLITGPIVASFDLGAVVRRHAERRKADPSTLMTSVLRRCAPHNLSRSEVDDLAVILESGSHRLLHYQGMSGQSCLDVDIAALSKSVSGSVEVRTDVLDTMIDVCSLNVLPEAADNFDYKAIRGDLVRQSLANDEIVDHRLYVEILQETDFAASVYDLKTYATVSSNVLKRWGQLVSPDANLFTASSFRYSAAFDSYIDEAVDIARTSVVRDFCIVSAETVIGEGAVVERSVIGRGCKIGPNARIVGCFLWGGVTVAEGATVTSCLLASGSSVGQGATLGPGCVVSFGVQVPAEETIDPETRLTLLSADEASAVDDLEAEATIVAAGVQHPGTIPPAPAGSSAGSRRPSRRASSKVSADDDADAAAAVELLNGGSGETADAASADAAPRQMRVYDPLENCDADSSDDEDGAMDGTAGLGGPSTIPEFVLLRGNSLVAQRKWCVCGADHLVPDPVYIDDDDDGDDDDEGAAEDPFVSEIRETIGRGVREGIDATNVLMEVKSLRMTFDRTNTETAGTTLEVLLQLINFAAPSLKDEFASWKRMFATWSSVVNAIATPEAMVELIDIAGDVVSDNGDAGTKLFPSLLLELYERDVVTEEACLKWKRETTDDVGLTLVEAAKGFFTWLEEADEEDSDEEDESEYEDDDEDDDDDEDSD